MTNAGRKPEMDRYCICIETAAYVNVEEKQGDKVKSKLMVMDK